MAEFCMAKTLPGKFYDVTSLHRTSTFLLINLFLFVYTFLSNDFKQIILTKHLVST